MAAFGVAMGAGQLLVEAWLLFLASLLISAALFPLVVVFSFFYNLLCNKFPKTPRVLLWAVVTFIAVFLVLLLLEIYFGLTIADAAFLARKS